VNLDPASLFDLTGRVAFVTGASSGLGVGFARTLAAAGATVVVGARREDRLAQLAAELPLGDYVVVDMADSESIDAAVDAVLARHGRFDVLVNNAGTTSLASAEDEAIEQFRNVVEINLVGTYRLAQLAGRSMLAAGAGSIINVASIHSAVAASPLKQASYCASKSGLTGLTRELAVQWADRNVRVNALAPGYFPSELTDPLLGSERGAGYIQRKTPMRRPGEPWELAGPLLLLASDAGSYITGETLTVDGGWTAW
jgi:NAD(P)-dependent dehydrogenase (short-subunit alcohol dehydrogenase family)